MVLSPGNDTVWFAFEKTHSGISKEARWDKVSQEAGRTFKSINVRCRGWCSDESSEVRQEGVDARITTRGPGDWLDVDCEGARGGQDDAQLSVLGEWVGAGTMS